MSYKQRPDQATFHGHRPPHTKRLSHHVHTRTINAHTRSHDCILTGLRGGAGVVHLRPKGHPATPRQSHHQPDSTHAGAEGISARDQDSPGDLWDCAYRAHARHTPDTITCMMSKSRRVRHTQQPTSDLRTGYFQHYTSQWIESGRQCAVCKAAVGGREGG